MITHLLETFFTNDDYTRLSLAQILAYNCVETNNNVSARQSFVIPFIKNHTQKYVSALTLSFVIAAGSARIHPFFPAHEEPAADLFGSLLSAAIFRIYGHARRFFGFVNIICVVSDLCCCFCFNA